MNKLPFLSLSLQLFDWAKTEDAPKDRLLTFYHLADCIAARLKGLFTLFAGHLVKPFADTLNQVNISKTGWWLTPVRGLLALGALHEAREV